MDRGAKAIAVILIASLVVGLAVIATHSSYRQAAAAILRGEPEESPLWLDNERYYPEVTLQAESRPDDPE